VEIVFVVLPPADREFREHDWSAFGERLAPLYCGGASRRDSVLNGLVACASAVDPNDWMLVHDAVRPCLGKADLRRLIDEAGTDEVGGILAVPVADTLKRSDGEHRVAATEPREGLWQAQTPQMFRHGMLLRALRDAEHVTDDASAVEKALGYKPKLVQASSVNSNPWRFSRRALEYSAGDLEVRRKITRFRSLSAALDQLRLVAEALPPRSRRR